MSPDEPATSLYDAGPGPRLLIAEDDAASAHVLRTILRQEGYRIGIACDGPAALAVLEAEGPPDALLLDWMLPEISGLELCHLARQRWDAVELPILMVTAKGDPESVYAAFDAGASDYVVKPFRGAEIRARVAAHLRMRRLVAERRRMEEHLRDREKLFALGLVAGGVAHDLNNPLAVIAGHAQLLLRDSGGGEQGEQLREILVAVERCRRIVGDLLGFARRHPAERGPTDVAAVVRDTLAMREKAMRTAGIHPSLHLPETLPAVIADAHQLQQVFLNVLLNAEQAMTEGGRIRVSVAHDAEDGVVCADFLNDGPPIPPDVLPSVFEPFFTTKPLDEGTGLGLAVCRRIVREHGGEIEVESGPGGTRFRVRLPVDASSPGSVPAGR